VKPDYLVTAEHFHDLFLQNTFFLDVRAEGEFAKGCLPNAINLPILNDHERHLVGTCFKQQGQQAAIQLGHELVCGVLKTSRMQKWCERVADKPNTHVYCWRGGMRSNLARQWMSEAGVDVPLIEGGYKALRRSLMEVIESAARNVSMIRIGGETGVAKTRLINEIDCAIDLEKHAHHRGSSFGRMVNQQPTQANFEHMLAIDLLHKTQHAGDNKTLFVEDESRSIGLSSIPLTFFEAMRRSPLVVVEMPFEFRVQTVLQDYVIDMLAAYQEKDAEKGFERFSDYLSEGLLRIQKRLGLERYKQANDLLTKALQTQLNTGDVSAHEAWITLILRTYYDPMYAYQIQENNSSVVFRGSYAEVLDWVRQLNAA
jgi:tRNA 2-selenouridine synthase